MLKGFHGDWRADTDEHNGLPPPPAHKDVTADTTPIELLAPVDGALGRTPFNALVARRRSRRDYTDAPLSLAELSFLLWCTQGIAGHTQEAIQGTTCALRPVPSAGARNPFETYLVLRRVSGVAPGIYRFLPREFKLLPLCVNRDFSQAARMICYGQEHVESAAALFVWSAIPYRMEWRYGYIAHRMIAMEAGHVCQNLHLAAEALDCGACAIAGYDQPMLDRLINVDGKDEFAVYLATVGKCPPGAA